MNTFSWLRTVTVRLNNKRRPGYDCLLLASDRDVEAGGHQGLPPTEDEREDEKLREREIKSQIVRETYSKRDNN